MSDLASTEAQYSRELDHLFRAGQYRPALELALKASEKHPKNADFHLAICDGHLFLGDVEKAYQALKKGLAIDGTRPNLVVRQLQIYSTWNIAFNICNPQDAYVMAEIGCHLADATVEMELPEDLWPLAYSAAAHLYSERSQLAELLGRPQREVRDYKQKAVLCYRDAVRLNQADENLRQIYLWCAEDYHAMEAESQRVLEAEWSRSTQEAVAVSLARASAKRGDPTADLIRAVNAGDCLLAENAIRRGGNINLKLESGRTLVVVAAVLGHTDILELLLDCGADPNRGILWGGRRPKSALDICIEAGNGRGALSLLARKGLIGFEMLTLADMIAYSKWLTSAEAAGSVETKTSFKPVSVSRRWEAMDNVAKRIVERAIDLSRDPDRRLCPKLAEILPQWHEKWSVICVVLITYLDTERFVARIRESERAVFLAAVAERLLDPLNSLLLDQRSQIPQQFAKLFVTLNKRMEMSCKDSSHLVSSWLCELLGNQPIEAPIARLLGEEALILARGMLQEAV